MSFRSRILLALLAVGLVPVAIVGAMAEATSRRELIETVGASQALAAAEVARQCEAFVLNGVEHLQLSASYLPFDDLSPVQTATALRIPFRQLPWVDVLVLLRETGTAVGEPVYDQAPDPDGPAREPIGPR